MQINIMIVGTHTSIMETIARLIDKEEKWRAIIAFDINDAMEKFQQQSFKLVLICAGLSAEDEYELARALNELDPSLPIVKHYGGGSGLLYAEIYQALGG